jgi:2-haloacid dehalogenase
MDFGGFEVLTFDCYGTLIDWEAGILGALAPLRGESIRVMDDDAVLEHYALSESRIQSGQYQVGREMATFFGVDLEAEGEGFLAESISGWRPFPDTVSALAKLKEHYQLAIVSNIDNDLIALSVKQIPIEFDHIVTAQQVGGYKPSHENFLHVIERVGVEKERVLHVAQSLYHDIQPANELGLSNVWVNRRGGKKGSGATFPATATPTLEVPDLATLASLACPP